MPPRVSVPVLIVVLPVYVFVPDRVSVLLDEVDLVTEPAPLITPDKVWFVEDAKVKLAPVAILMAPAYEALPSVPAPPRVSVPASTAVSPV